MSVHKNNISELFESIDEPYASGLFEEPEKGYFYRHCCAYAKWFDMSEPPVYKSGEKLYPDGRRLFAQNYDSRAVKPLYATTYGFNTNKLEKSAKMPIRKVLFI